MIYWFKIQVAKAANAEIHFLHLLMTPIDWVKLPLEKEQFFPETKLQKAWSTFLIAWIV